MREKASKYYSKRYSDSDPAMPPEGVIKTSPLNC